MLYIELLLFLFFLTNHPTIPTTPYKMHVNDACALFPLLKGSGLNICVTILAAQKIKTTIECHRSNKWKARRKKSICI